MASQKTHNLTCHDLVCGKKYLMTFGHKTKKKNQIIIKYLKIYVVLAIQHRIYICLTYWSNADPLARIKMKKVYKNINIVESAAASNQQW